MASIAITLTPELVDSICANKNYRETVSDAPNPESKEQFVQRAFIDFAKSHISLARRNAAAASALPVVDADVSVSLQQ